MRKSITKDFPIIGGINHSIDDLQIQNLGFVDLNNFRHAQKQAVESHDFFKRISDKQAPQPILKLVSFKGQLLAFSWNRLYKVIEEDFLPVGDYINGQVDTILHHFAPEDLTFPDIWIDTDGNIHSVGRTKDKLFYTNSLNNGVIIDKAETVIPASLGLSKEKILIASFGGKRTIIVRAEDAGLRFYDGDLNDTLINYTFFDSSFTGDIDDFDFSLELESQSEIFKINVYYKIGSQWKKGAVYFDSIEKISLSPVLEKEDITYSKAKTPPVFFNKLKRFAYWDTFQYGDTTLHIIWNANNGFYVIDDNQKVLAKISQGFTAESISQQWDFKGKTKVIGDDIYFPILLNPNKIKLQHTKEGFTTKEVLGLYIVKISINKDIFVCDHREVNNTLMLASPALKFYDGEKLTEFGFCERPELKFESEGKIVEEDLDFVFKEIDRRASVQLTLNNVDAGGTLINNPTSVIKRRKVSLTSNLYIRSGSLNTIPVIPDPSTAIRHTHFVAQFHISEFSTFETKLKDWFGVDDYVVTRHTYSDGTFARRWISQPPIEPGETKEFTTNVVMIVTHPLTNEILFVGVLHDVSYYVPRSGANNATVIMKPLTDYKNNITRDSSRHGFFPIEEADFKFYKLATPLRFLETHGHYERDDRSDPLNPEVLDALFSTPTTRVLSGNKNIRDNLGDTLTNKPKLINFSSHPFVGDPTFENVDIFIEFSTASDAYIAGGALTWLQDIRIRKGSQSMSSFGPGHIMGKVAGGTAHTTGKIIRYRFFYTKAAELFNVNDPGDYTFEFNSTDTETGYFPTASESFFSFEIDEIQYEVRDAEIGTTAGKTWIKLTLDKTVGFSETGVTASMTINTGESEDYNTVAKQDNTITFTHNGDLSGQLNDDGTVNKLAFVLKVSGGSTGIDRNFTNTYRYSACYRWLDGKGYFHYSRSSPPIDINIKNYVGVDNTVVKLQCDNLNFSEKENVEIVLFRAFVKQETPQTSPLEPVNLNMREEAVFKNNKLTKNTGFVSSKEGKNFFASRLFLDHYYSIFQPEGCEAIAFQHQSTYLGSMNHLENALISSLPADSENPTFLSFSYDFSQFELIEHNILKLARLDNGLIVFTDKDIRRKSSRLAPSVILNPSLKNYLVNPLSVSESIIGVSYEGTKGLYLIQRSDDFGYMGFPIDRALLGDKIVQTYSSEKHHEINFITESGEVFVYNHLFKEWSRKGSRKTETDHDRITYNIGTDNFLNKQDFGEKTSKHEHMIETGWFDFYYGYGQFYLKSVTFEGDFTNYDWIKCIAYYNKKETSKEVRTAVRQDPLIQYGSDQTYGTDKPRALEPRFLKTYSFVPKNQKITGIKFKLMIRGRYIKLSKVAFELLIIPSANRIKNQQQFI